VRRHVAATVRPPCGFAAIVAATLVVIGVQIFFSSFLLSILGLRRSLGLGSRRSLEQRGIPWTTSTIPQ